MANRAFHKLIFRIFSFWLVFVSSTPYFMVATHASEGNTIGYSLISLSALTLKNTTIKVSNDFLKAKHPAIYNRQYLTSGVYDSAMAYSFFIPLNQFKPYYAWWDTGILLMGSGVGCRQVLQKKWFNQSWFIGVYGYYDVLGEVERDLTVFALECINSNPQSRSALYKDLPYRLLYPVRLNVGLEFAGSDWGQLTFNIYGMLLPDVRQGCTIREKGGVSGRATLNLYPTFKPFICGAISSIERQYGLVEKGFTWQRLAGMEEFSPEKVWNLSIGIRWTISPEVDFEAKYLMYESHNYQMPLHVGLHFKYEALSQSDKFQGRLYQVPERYIPYYPNALRFHPVYYGIKSMVDHYSNKQGTNAQSPKKSHVM